MKQLPPFVNETQLEHDLMLGDDVDSFLGCNLLQEITNGKWKVNYYFNFQNTYQINKTSLKPIGVDMALGRSIRTFDNHLTQLFPNSYANQNCVNLNVYNNITVQSYAKKYPLSTLLLIMSIYDIPLPKTQLGKEILLSVDSSHKGFYASNSYFKSIYINWLEEIGYTELIDVLDKRNKEYFHKVQNHYNLNDKILLNEEGRLHTNIMINEIQPHFDYKLSLPEEKFKLKKKYKHIRTHAYDKLPPTDQIINLVYPYKDKVMYNYIPQD
ncbi:hypothetical protein [Priestia filamentosa]|uniref:hypothetical protein n=1 Tax=Priestia filamentosa TaxID=1402861 RepID=UPI000A164397|nr:hypothetical protein [Priestia filamentosa]OXS67236.1 hypothetical protein B1B01_17240 [Priestia filamentosa]